MEKSYCKKIDRNSKKDLIFLPGFRGSSSLNMVNREEFKDFNLISCDYRGHGSRKGNSDELDFKGTFDDYSKLISERLKKGKEISLIGLSYGGTLALGLGNKHKKIKRVFAIGSMNYSKDIKNILKKRENPFDTMINGSVDIKNLKIGNIKSIFPKNSNKCDPGNKEKFFLIHAINDGIVSINHGLKNAKQLCLITDTNIRNVKNNNKLKTDNVLFVNTNIPKQLETLSHSSINFQARDFIKQKFKDFKK